MMRKDKKNCYLLLRFLFIYFDIEMDLFLEESGQFFSIIEGIGCIVFCSFWKFVNVFRIMEMFLVWFEEVVFLILY